MLFEEVEISITVEKLVFLANAVGGDEQVDRLTHGETLAAKPPIMRRRFHRESGVVQLDDLELA